MALISVRREHGRSRGRPGDPWPLERPDLSGAERTLLARLAALPTLPAHLFGERGLQTTPATRAALVPATEAGRAAVPLRAGGDVGAFALGRPRLAIDRALVRLDRFAGVALVVRQTARRPIAALNDGAAFRNSLLAGFADDEWPAGLLAALLNSAVVGWHHERRFRDARQGMPQVKVGHLRQIPAPPALAPVRAELADLGAALAGRNDGIRADERARLDALVADAYELDGAERALVAGGLQRA
jgi:hypothetical protein